MSVPALIDHDPATLGWPSGLPLELALGQSSVREICEAYGISKGTYLTLRQDPNFKTAVKAAIDLLSQEGMSFKVKARAQAEALLKTSWELIHAPADDVPAAVKARMIEHIVRVAGLDASLDQKAAAAQANQMNNALQINIHLE